MWYRRGVAIYDKVYRALHGLERAGAQVPPILTLEVVRSVRRLTLRDGTEIRVGHRIGALHLNNARLAGLHGIGATELGVGLEFRRELFASLRVLAERARPGGPLAEVVAFSALTILHHGLPRIGFERDPRGPAWPWLTSAYQRALLASMRPNGHNGARRIGARSQRLWISRATLLRLYGEVDRRVADGPEAATSAESGPAAPERMGPRAPLPRMHDEAAAP